MTRTERIASIASKHPVLTKFRMRLLMHIRDADRGDLSAGWCVVEHPPNDDPGRKEGFWVTVHGDYVTRVGVPSEAEAEAAVAELKTVSRHVVSEYVAACLALDVFGS